jgi:hypothetical protein
MMDEDFSSYLEMMRNDFLSITNREERNEKERKE